MKKSSGNGTGPSGGVAVAVPRSWSSFSIAAGLMCVFLLPILICPDVVSLDGPKHLYNAAVINDALWGRPLAAETYEVSFRPVPNWIGHFSLLAMLQALPLRLIPRAMMSIAFLSVACSIVWARRQTGRPRGAVLMASAACALASGWPWLMGFDSFSLGSAIAMMVIGLWWRWKHRFSAIHACGIALLLTILYLSHLVPWAWSLCMLTGLAVLTPGERRRQRAGWTGLAISSALMPLWLYLDMAAETNQKPGFVWYDLDVFSLRSWIDFTSRLDCIDSLKTGFLPFATSESPTLALLLNPFLSIGAALLLLAICSVAKDLRQNDDQHLAWGIVGLAGMWIAFWVPEVTGGHGLYLPSRLMLLSMMSLVPYIRSDVGRLAKWPATLLLLVGFGVHATEVWDYGLTVDAMLRPLPSAASTIEPGQKIYAVKMGHRDFRFRIDPRWHTDALLALWSHNVLLSNYEAHAYYFPVKFREGIARPPEPNTLSPDDASGIEDVASRIEPMSDVLILWTSDETALAAARKIFQRVLYRDPQLCILSRH